MLPAPFNPPSLSAQAVPDRLSEARDVADLMGVSLARALHWVLAMERSSVEVL